MGLRKQLMAFGMPYKLAELLGNAPQFEGAIAVGGTALTASAAELNILDGVTATATTLNYLDQTANATNVGAAASVTGTLTTSIVRIGSLFHITFTLAAVRITVTDAAGSGSYGSTKLFDFVQGAVIFLGSRQNYTANVEGAALTTAVGDAVFEIGLGTTPISAAADGTLGNDAKENIGQAVAITNSSGTGAGTAVTGVTTTLDGTATALDINLNWSGSAATIDANSTIDITGTITVAGLLLGDD